MGKENEYRFRIDGLKGRKLWLCFILFLFHIFGFVVQQVWAGDNYEKKTYIFIPWGDGKGQVPIFQKYQKKVDGSMGWLRLGPSRLLVDDEGSVYLTSTNKEQKQVIKGFDSKGKEIGVFDPQIMSQAGMSEFEFDGDKVVFAEGIGNRVVELNKDLSLYKEVKVPEKEFAIDGSTELGNGMVCHPFVLKNKSRMYVFDEDVWEKNGNSPYLSRPKDKFSLGVGLNNDGTGYVVMVKGSYADGFSQPITLSEPLTIFRNLPTDLMSDFTQREDYFWKDIDKNGNIYSAYDFKGKEQWPFLIKVSPSGKLSFQANLPGIAFLSGFHFGTNRVPVAIDRNGNIFCFRASSEGLYIDEWVNLTR
jgi:hypothetical protein